MITVKFTLYEAALIRDALIDAHWRLTPEEGASEARIMNHSATKALCDHFKEIIRLDKSGGTI